MIERREAITRCGRRLVAVRPELQKPCIPAPRGDETWQPLNPRLDRRRRCYARPI